MSTVSDITKALAAKYGSNLLGVEKKEPVKVAPRVYHEPEYEYTGPVVSNVGAPKLFPSDRMALRSTSSKVIMPRRPPIQMFDYTDDELEWMFSTPVKRDWNFETWLEVIGLPTDLHEKHDGATYSYAARAFLSNKQKAHRS
jgi:hypothetical protein